MRHDPLLDPATSSTVGASSGVPFTFIGERMRRFYLQRHNDISGVSGTGRVAEGVLFDDGVAVIRWISDKPSTVIWNSLDDAMDIHGHNGNTSLVFIDATETQKRALRSVA